MAQVQAVTEAAYCGPVNSEWARPPKTGATLEGLYRSQIFELVQAGAVRTAAIKKPGAARVGMRLVHLPSLRAWIAKHEALYGIGA